MEEEDKEKAGPSLTVDDALKMYEEYESHWHDNYREAAIDLKMYMGDPATHYGNGWDSKYTAPTGAMVVDNELPQYVHQVTNDIRQNVPSIKVLPVSDGDIETGEIYRGLFRAIEDHSHADEVCDTAAESAVICSIGFMGVDHDYCNEQSDEQEIVFKTIPDALSEFLDPASVEYDGRDSNGHVSLVPISKIEFERQHKGKKFSSFTAPKGDASGKDGIVLGQIFIREFGGERSKTITVRRYLFSGEELLVESTFPGKYIPRVPIYGEMRWIDGKRVLSSLIRQARSPQRRLNHMLSKESQVLAQAPVAPILAVEGTVVNERKQWQIPGLENVLEYRQKDLDGNDAPTPIRLQPPGASSGFLEAIASAKEAIKASMGIYNAGLGKREGDASGIALERLDRSGDVATFHYPDNVRRSYGHMGEIVVDMVPVIYDTKRVIQTLNDENDVVMVGVNGAPMQKDQKKAYDLTKGKFRIRISTGASYTTRRQEEAEFLSQIAQKDPNFMQIGGDILFKSMDSPGAQALSARYKKLINPALLEEGEQAPPDPRVPQMEQALQQQQMQLQQLGGELQKAQQDAIIQNIDAKSVALTQKDKEVSLKADLEAERLKAILAEIENAKGELQQMLDMASQPIEQGQPQTSQSIEQPGVIEQAPEVIPEEVAVEQTDMVLRAQQANATLGILQGIQEQLGGLTQAIVTPKPITVVRANPSDPYSPITGAI